MIPVSCPAAFFLTGEMKRNELVISWLHENNVKPVQTGLWSGLRKCQDDGKGPDKDGTRREEARYRSSPPHLTPDSRNDMQVSALRELQSTSGEELSALMPSVLDKAFKGKL
jgi:hypothetical protein